MKYLLSSLLCLGFMVMDVRACDVCGCSAGNQSLGILPHYQSRFLGIQYLYNSFESNHPSLFENKPDEHAIDHYHTIQLWGRYNIGKRLQLFGFLPYKYNTEQKDGVQTINSGLGDASVMANILIVKEKDGNRKWQHQLLAGGGLKLPTGSYTGISEQDKQGIPNMQPGTGSWDFLANVNYTIRRKNTGLNADLAYTMTTANGQNYKFGNRFNAGLLGFYTISKDEWSLIPQIGFRYEYALHDYDNYSRKWLNEQSGGYLSFATIGLQGYYGKWGARLTYNLPMAQQYGNGYVTALRKLDAGILFLF